MRHYGADHLSVNASLVGFIKFLWWRADNVTFFVIGIPESFIRGAVGLSFVIQVISADCMPSLGINGEAF